MGKYYVQSGTMRSVVEAESERKAALWAVHQAMQQVLPIDRADDAPERADATDGVRRIDVLSARLSISPRGFDRDDAAKMPTLEVVTEWNAMVTTLDRLQRMLYRAA